MEYGGSPSVRVETNASMPSGKASSSMGWTSIFLRVLELLFSMIAFALVASAEKLGVAAFAYLVAAGVICFVYSLLQITFEFIGTPSVQFDVWFEFVNNLFLFSSGAAAATALQEVTDLSGSKEGRVIGGVVFQFFTWIVSTIIFVIMTAGSISTLAGEVSGSGSKRSALTYGLS